MADGSDGGSGGGDSAASSAAAAAPSMAMRTLLSTIRRSFPSVSHVETSTVQQWREQDKMAAGQQGACKTAVVILDTRPDYEYNISHIPGATRVNPDLSDVQATHDSLVEKYSGCEEVKVACYCSLGYRSSKYADALQKYVQTNPDSPLSKSLKTFNIDGSLFKWANESREMVDVDEQRTVYAHPYSAVWGKLLRHDLRRWSMPDQADPAQ